MSNNVFGTPVTDSTVQQINIGITNITAQHRAEVALTYINAEGKADDARRFVADVKKQYGAGTCALCTIYNATGNTLTFSGFHSWAGTVWQSPYPHVLQNGQWGAFLHVRGTLAGPSKEGVVYRGRNNAGLSRDWVLVWNIKRMNYQNKVYTEIRTGGSTINWDTVNQNMKQQLTNHVTTSLGCFSSVSVGAGPSPNYVGIMSLQGVTRANDVTALANDISTIFSSLDSKYEGDEGVEGGDDSDDDATPTTAE
ncbi:hypothetical protein CASFOL_022274 [Castilleja foliolosa]|uniref:Jasmonate-induced protein n=1 Tax=Castilleja foliolosa TaxID=1961234 RepID=A0ABD3CY50_9LAMI